MLSVVPQTASCASILMLVYAMLSNKSVNKLDMARSAACQRQKQEEQQILLRQESKNCASVNAEVTPSCRYHRAHTMQHLQHRELFVLRSIYTDLELLKVVQGRAHRKKKRTEKTMLLSVIQEKLMVNLNFPLA